MILTPTPPYRLDLTVWVLRRLPVNAMDRWDGDTYRRVLAIGDASVEAVVRQSGSARAPRLHVELEGERIDAETKRVATEALTKLLGLDIDLAPFQRLVAADRALADIAAPFAGFKPPRMPSVFEAMVNGIACQQISLANGLQLLNKFCAAFGLWNGDHFAFPRPVDLCRAQVDDMRRLGFSSRKGQNILDRAVEITNGELDLERLADLNDSGAIEALRKFSGIGRWTAEYILLRGLGRLDVYPADDVGSQNRVQHWLNLPDRPGYDGIYKIVDSWRPYRGLIYFLLLLNDQARRGWIGEAA